MSHDELNRASQPDIDLATLKRLIADLPDDWRVLVDSPSRMLLLDAQLNGQGYLDLTTQRVVTLHP